MGEKEGGRQEGRKERRGKRSERRRKIEEGRGGRELEEVG